MEGVVFREVGGLGGRLPYLAVEVVAAEQRPRGRAAQYVRGTEAELLDVSRQSIAHEQRHGYIVQRSWRLGRGQDWPTFDDNDLLSNGDGADRHVYAVEG